MISNILSQKGYHGNNKNISCIPDAPNYSSIKCYVSIRSTNEDILDCLLFNCAIINTDVTQSAVP